MSNTKKIFNNVFDLLIQDETLLRLLFYPPKDLITKQPDPLSKDLPNILEMDIGEKWGIIDDHILDHSKADDLETKAICRLYVYSGKTRPSLTNKATVKQEIVIDIFCHKNYKKDQRLSWISDRLNELMVGERIKNSLGRIDYRTGYDFTAPKNHEAYRHVYEVGRSKR